MKRSLAAFAAAWLLLPSPLGAWGKTAHEEINVGAILSLPEPLRKFYGKHEELLAEESVAPDRWKRRDRNEGPRHFINIDSYEPYPFPSFPQSMNSLVRKDTIQEVTERGTLPWTIEDFYGRLVIAFRSRDARKIALASAHLGHYIGDLYQPLHTTRNHDGKDTGNKGIHARFEETLIRRFEKDFRVKSASAAVQVPPADVREFVIESLRSGYPGVAQIMQADRECKQLARRKVNKYYKELNARVGNLARNRIKDAAWALASIWYSAWIEAGKPKLPG